MAAVTVPTDSKCDIILASNAAVPILGAGAALGYEENGDNTPVHTYGRANNASAVVHLIAGRQAPVGFRPAIEGDSDIFQLTLEIAMDTAGAPVAEAVMDRFAFDPLIALIEAPSIPYVAVINGHGQRWFTFAEYVTGSYTWTAHEHASQVKFTEVAIAPPVVTTP